MQVTIAACLILITACMLVLTVGLALAAYQVWRTAQAVEVKIYEAGEQLDRLRDVTSAAGQLAHMFRSPWVRGLGLALGAATTYYTVRSRRAETAGSRSNGGG
ncbi:MAG: hypothetical protein HY554_01950 [Elusimicrobia bacterium]|nr:hypothetical protein [Elusimicrobiota bacterium]